MIDPNNITTVRVGQLPEAPFNSTDNVPHEVGTELKRGSINNLATYIASIIGTTSAIGFLPITVLDGQTIPATTTNEWFLAGKGTFSQGGGFPDIVCTEELNAIIGNGTSWSLGVAIPITVDPPAAMITQEITDGVINYAPSSDAVYAFGLTLEKVVNKISEIINYSEISYPNEKAVHDALDMKLNISDLPSNLIFYSTTAVADISGYFKLVDNVEDIDYDQPAVDVPTGAITTTEQLISSLVSAPGLLIGNPGIINITTVGNIKRISGTGTANFYFKAFHRDVAGVETLVGTSNNSETVSNSVYEQFSTTLLWNDGDFIVTDRIVLKFYANRIAGGGNPSYNFQFGGDTPVRTIVPVPFFIVAGEYELKANKQNNLTADPTDLKYPTITAVNAGLLTKQALLTNPITGIGTINYLPKFTGTSALADSLIFDNGTNVGIGTTTPGAKLEVVNTGAGIKDVLYLNNANNGVGVLDGVRLKLKNFNIESKSTFGTADNLLTIGYSTDKNLAITQIGNVLVNTTTDNGVDKLQVNGSVIASLGYKTDRGISVKAPANIFGGYQNINEYGIITETPTGTNAYWIASGRKSDNTLNGGIQLFGGGNYMRLQAGSYNAVLNSNGFYTDKAQFGDLTSYPYGADKLWVGGRTTLYGTALINTTTDNGVDKLQVNGSIIGTALKLSTTPSISAGTYDILTRNISTGAVEKVSDLRKYKVYTALISQTGTSTPTAIILENTIGTVVWSRIGIGSYLGTLTGAFTASKTYISISNGFFNYLVSSTRNSNDSIIINAGNDGEISNASIEIRVYN
jgi:hypothetical protein